VQKCCKTCKYTELRAWQHPCNVCIDSENYLEWTPKANALESFRGWIMKRFIKEG
jgi:hypothetical protein